MTTPALDFGDDVKFPTNAAAAFCGLRPKTFERMRSKGGGPRFYRVAGNRTVYRLGDLKLWLAQRANVKQPRRAAGASNGE